MTITKCALFPLLLVLCCVVHASTPSHGADENTADAYDYEGYSLARAHQTQKAIQYFTSAIRANPSDWIPYVHRAHAYLEADEWAKAIEDCNAALRIKPTQVNAYVTRAAALYYLGRDVESLSDVAIVIKSRPSDSNLRTMLSIREEIYGRPLQDSPEAVHAALNKVNEAVEHARNPKKRAIALNSRSWLLATSPIKRVRDGDQALQDALEACGLSYWKTANDIDTLAAAYAEKGDFQKAIHAQQQSLALPGGKPEHIKEYHQHLSEYERHQPHRMTAADRQAHPPTVDR